MSDTDSFATALLNPYKHGDTSKTDLERAVAIAQHRWKEIDDKKNKIIRKYTKNVFAIWKLEHGVVRKKGIGLSGALGLIRERPSDDESFALLDSLEPWECMPFVTLSSPPGLVQL